MGTKFIDPLKILMIFLLVIIDQLIKLIVKGYYGVKAPIVGNIISFKPTHNKKLSWFNSLFNIEPNKILQAILTVIVILLIYSSYRFYYENKVQGTLSKVLEMLLLAGSICSLMDKVFWNGSLDYIMLRGFFIFDLKDVYLTIFEVGMIIFVLKNWSKICKINEKQLLSDYIKFISIKK